MHAAYLSILNLFEKNKSLIRFAIVGTINTGVDFLTFTFVHGVFGIDKFFSQTAGYCTGIINSFILNKLWTFVNGSYSSSNIVQLIRFLVVNAVSLAVSLACLKLMSDLYGMNIYISKVMVTCAAQISNYCGYRFWVFNK